MFEKWDVSPAGFQTARRTTIGFENCFLDTAEVHPKSALKSTYKEEKMCQVSLAFFLALSQSALPGWESTLNAQQLIVAATVCSEQLRVTFFQHIE